MRINTSSQLRRVIPCLQFNRRRLVKTVRFVESRYLGDPINAVKIFNEKEVDEMMLIDIAATMDSREPDYEFLRQLAEEAFMPLSYGGGVSTLQQAEKILKIGFEKIVVCSAAVDRPGLISEMAQAFGSQSVIASVDIKKNWLGRVKTTSRSGTKDCPLTPLELAQRFVADGAGEILIQFVDRDGTGTGFDWDILKQISEQVQVPIVGCGGIGSYSDIRKAFADCNLSGVAAGSQFVFQGKHRAVLIHYLASEQLDELRSF